MTRTEARWLFLQLFARLTLYARRRGLQFIVYGFDRTAAEQAEHVRRGTSKVKRSQHQDWLAANLVLVDEAGKPIWFHYLGDEYERLGRYWERLGRRYGVEGLTRWGGRFGRDDAGQKPGWDPYHFEISSKYRQGQPRR